MNNYTSEKDNRGRWYVHGDGLPGFYGGNLYPESRFDTKEDADRSAKLCDSAYKAGYKQAQEDIKQALGVLNNGMY